MINPWKYLRDALIDFLSVLVMSSDRHGPGREKKE